MIFSGVDQSVLFKGSYQPYILPIYPPNPMELKEFLVPCFGGEVSPKFFCVGPLPPHIVSQIRILGEILLDPPHPVNKPPYMVIAYAVLRPIHTERMRKWKRPKNNPKRSRKNIETTKKIFAFARYEWTFTGVV